MLLMAKIYKSLLLNRTQPRPPPPAPNRISRPIRPIPHSLNSRETPCVLRTILIIDNRALLRQIRVVSACLAEILQHGELDHKALGRGEGVVGRKVVLWFDGS